MMAKGESSSDQGELDLSLSSNHSEVRVEHFILDLVCDLEKCVFYGSMTLFLKGMQNFNQRDQNGLHIKLDCVGICVTRCQSIDLNERAFPISTSEECSSNEFRISESQLNKYRRIYPDLKNTNDKHELEFQLEKNFLDVKVPHLSRWEDIVITIHYTTKPDGPSLMWTKNQDGRPCVFTIGDAFNNRSLFPSQDMPEAMATWQCKIAIPEEADTDLVVLMTGEDEPHVYYDGNGAHVFDYFSSYRMPSSTFALAVGPWSCQVLDQNELVFCEDLGKWKDTSHRTMSIPRCRIHFPKILHSEVIKSFSEYLPKCFASIASVLEPYPFQRLDVLIAPDCFDSLGLACPNLLILSQSVLSSDLSLFYRVAHELCHNWFGILMGPRNWTEDWVTEGMCCYLEDIIHAKALEWPEQEIQERNELKSFLKYEVLKSELEYIPDSLQRLRPDGAMSVDQISEQSCVKNGVRSETAHVHYMKGFFLLKLLEDTAGQESLLFAIKTFIAEYKGKLFTSQELLEFFFVHCPRLSSSKLTVSSLCHEWLDSPGLPLALESFPYSIRENRLYQQVLKEVDIVKAMSKTNLKRKAGASSSRPRDHTGMQQDTLRSLQVLLPDQVILLLCMILDHQDGLRIPQNVMCSIRAVCAIHRANAEVQHAWCELVVQQKCRPWYEDVEQFLVRHRAMGLYLYGELMISESRPLQAIAHKCYQHNRLSMPRAVKRELREILGLEDGEELNRECSVGAKKEGRGGWGGNGDDDAQEGVARGRGGDQRNGGEDGGEVNERVRGRKEEREAKKNE